MSTDVKVAILRTAGTNCDQETKFAFEDLGARADLVHIKQLILNKYNLEDYHILAIPGGFSYGDDIASGKILANELRLSLSDAIKRFVEQGKLIIGICNGFQILAKSGILPGWDFNPHHFSQDITLTTNDSCKFEDRWIHLEHAPNSSCVWTRGIVQPIFLPVAHGEGKFVPRDQDVLNKLKSKNQVVFRYCSPSGLPTRYPENPNGSSEDIAGICDETGRVFGLMPHPERHFLLTQHPFWTRLKKKDRYGDGAKIFRNGINYIRKNL